MRETETERGAMANENYKKTKMIITKYAQERAQFFPSDSLPDAKREKRERARGREVTSRPFFPCRRKLHQIRQPLQPRTRARPHTNNFTSH